MNQTLKHVAIRTALEGIALLKLGRLFPNASGRGIIFTLHHVRPKTRRAFDPNAHLEVTPDFLETAILAARETGLRPVPLSALPQLLRRGNPQDRYCAFTLDDGYRNNAQFAAPLFRKYGVPYTIFICPGFVERTRIAWWETAADILASASEIDFDFGSGPQKIQTGTLSLKGQAFAKFAKMVETLDEDEAVARIGALAIRQGIDPMDFIRREIMDADELAELAKDPLCSLGGHTLTHCNLARVDDARLKREIRESCARITDWTGQQVETFAYPYGWERAASHREFLTLSTEGFTAAVTTRPGVLGAADNPAALSRVSLNGLFQKKRYVDALISGIAFKLM